MLDYVRIINLLIIIIIRYADILLSDLSVSAADSRTKLDGNTPVFPRRQPLNQPSSSCAQPYYYYYCCSHFINKNDKFKMR